MIYISKNHFPFYITICYTVTVLATGSGANPDATIFEFIVISLFSGMIYDICKYHFHYIEGSDYMVNLIISVGCCGGMV